VSDHRTPRGAVAPGSENERGSASSLGIAHDIQQLLTAILGNLSL